MITISKIHLSKMKKHAIEVFPNECVGAMIGYFDTQKRIKVAQKIIRVENSESKNKKRRFSITNDDYKELEDYCEQTNMTLLGFYHSHPNHPAIPSETDLNYAWPNFSYIIVSIYDWIFKDAKSFELDLETNQFVEELLRIEQ